MRKLTKLLAAGIALAATLPANASHPTPASSRVIVSTTLNSTLQFFDSASLAETQPPLPSRGAGPVRLWVQTFEDTPYLFVANHGAATGSLGIFDLSGDLVLETPLSPIPARAGSVGVVAGLASVGQATIPVVAVTNTTFALGGCSMPKGSVTVYDARRLPLGPVTEIGTLELTGSIPYAVALDGPRGTFSASTNCGNTLEEVAVTSASCAPDASVCPELTVAPRARRATGRGPDATLFDGARSLTYVTNIGGNSVSVFDASSPDAVTTVPLTGKGPIDAALADAPNGSQWLLTSNGGDDSISVIDRDVIEECIANAEATCARAELARIATKVKGGAPEGIAYDPLTNRAFVVNKGIMAPSLSVVQLDADGRGGTDIEQIPLTVAGAGTPPAIIAFDVVVQTPAPITQH